MCVTVYVWSLYLSLFGACNVGGGGFEYSTLWAYPKIWYAMVRPQIQFCFIDLINIYRIKIAHKIGYMPVLDKPNHIAGLYLPG
jgi:hypothetical protein